MTKGINRSNKVRNSIKVFSQNRMKILFAIGCISTSEIVNQIELSKTLNMKYTTLNHHITRLRAEKLINEKNHLTKEGQNAIRFFKHWDKTFSKKLRAHKIQISINLLKLPQDFFNIKHKILSPFTNKKYKGLKGTIEGTTVLFYSSKKLMLVLPEVYGNNDTEILSAIHNSINQMYEVLKLEFPKIKLGNYEVCKFTSMHCAIVNSIIAESYLLEKGSCFQSENVCIDNSHGKPELESESLNNMFENLGIMMSAEQLTQENTKIKGILSQIEENFKNINDYNNNINAKKLLAEIKNVTNTMSKMPQKTTIPKGYGTYFM